MIPEPQEEWGNTRTLKSEALLMMVTTEVQSLKYEGNLQEKDHKDQKHSRILRKERHQKKKKNPAYVGEWEHKQPDMKL